MMEKLVKIVRQSQPDHPGILETEKPASTVMPDTGFLTIRPGQLTNLLVFVFWTSSGLLGRSGGRESEVIQ